MGMDRESVFMSTDAVLAQMRKRLQDRGMGLGEIAMALSGELGVSLETLWAYDDVASAVHRYQMEQLWSSPASSVQPDGSRQLSARQEAMKPSRDVAATMQCPSCGVWFTPSGRRRFCTDACRRTAWRRRHQAPSVPVVVPAPGQARRPVTVYECPRCETRALGEQRCVECGSFGRRVGLGGLCPHCDAPVAVTDLLGQAHAGS